MKTIGITGLLITVLMCASCGYVDRQTKMRFRGRVVDYDTAAPIPEAYIDIADNDEMLRLVLHPKNTTAENGFFDILHTNNYSRNYFLLIPVGGDSPIPENIFMEFTKSGYIPEIIRVNPTNLERDRHRAYLIEEIQLQKE